MIFNKRELISTPSDIHNYNTRQNTMLRLPNYLYDTNRKGPLYSGIKIYNHLPISIQRLNNVNGFKKSLSKLLNLYTFYNINEYFECNFAEI